MYKSTPSALRAAFFLAWAVQPGHRLPGKPCVLSGARAHESQRRSGAFDNVRGCFIAACRSGGRTAITDMGGHAFTGCGRVGGRHRARRDWWNTDLHGHGPRVLLVRNRRTRATSHQWRGRDRQPRRRERHVRRWPSHHRLALQRTHVQHVLSRDVERVRTGRVWHVSHTRQRDWPRSR